MRRLPARACALSLVVLAGACGLSTSGLAPMAGPGDGGASLFEGGENVDALIGPPFDGTAPSDTTANAASDATSEIARVGNDAPVQLQDGAVPDDGAPDAAKSDGPVESAVAGDGDGGGCMNGSGACGIIIPSGWSLVAFGGASSSSTCPTGFGPATTVFEGPSANGACSCGSCSVTTPPSCASGAINVFYDTVGLGGGRCNLMGSVSPLTNSPAGSCLTDLYQGDYRTFDIEYVPPPPTGGSCTAPGTPQNGNVTFAAQDRTCPVADAQAAGCTGNVCSPPALGAYRACITAPGNVTCPTGFTDTRHVVGTGASFDCSTCGCTVTAQCSGTVTLYSDMRCSNAPLAVPADGTCNRVTNLTTKPATSYNSYTYTGAPQNVACMTSGASSPQDVALVNEATVCCGG
jgi:hypothetical protein